MSINVYTNTLSILQVIMILNIEESKLFESQQMTYTSGDNPWRAKTRSSLSVQWCHIQLAAVGVCSVNENMNEQEVTVYSCLIWKDSWGIFELKIQPCGKRTTHNLAGPLTGSPKLTFKPKKQDT